jgi:hypothetical protein
MNVKKDIVLFGEKLLITSNPKKMKVQDIFKTKAVKEIETEILDIYFDNEKHGMHNETEVYTIRRLLSIRKNILNDMFVLDDKYKQLLYDFNEALIGQLKEMRKRTLALYQATKDTCQYGSLEVDGKCLLGYAYSTIHPVQTMRAKKIWAVLNGCLDNFMPGYDIDGAGSFTIRSWDTQIDTENEMLYGHDEWDNHNEGLDREMTKDMHLIYDFHNLFSHMEFSIFDLLWVRNFNIEIKVECDYHTYNTKDYCDDLNWGKCDFYD